MKPTSKRKPRLSAALRTRIVQIRASDPDRPPSLDAILDALGLEMDPQDGSKLRWEPLPSRGSVQNIVRSWEDLPEEVRQRDLHFQWHDLEKACIPWEAGNWVQTCLQVYEMAKIPAKAGLLLMRFFISSVTPFAFTNRWAKWCWRVHQVVPTYPAEIVLFLAREYTIAAQARDLLPDHPDMAVEGLTTFLRWFPDYAAPAEYLDQYQEAVQKGVIQPVEGLGNGTTIDIARICDVESSLPDLRGDSLTSDQQHAYQTWASFLIKAWILGGEFSPEGSAT